MCIPLTLQALTAMHAYDSIGYACVRLHLLCMHSAESLLQCHDSNALLTTNGDAAACNNKVESVLLAA